MGTEKGEDGRQEGKGRSGKSGCGRERWWEGRKSKRESQGERERRQEGGEEGGDRVTEESKKIYDTTAYKSDWCLHQYCIS